jgi:hypothetical protein
MDNAKVIRVEIDPTAVSKSCADGGVQGFLHEELMELQDALCHGGARLSMFTLPSWFHRTNTAVVKKVTPDTMDVLFHQKVQADMTTMITLLSSMAESLAKLTDPSQASRPPEPAPASITSSHPPEVFYLVRSEDS